MSVDLAAQYGVAIASLSVVVYVVRALTQRRNNGTVQLASLDLKPFLEQNTHTLQHNNEILSELSALIRQQGNVLERVLGRLDELWREAVRR